MCLWVLKNKKLHILHQKNKFPLSNEYQICKTIHCLLRNRAEFGGEKRAYKNFVLLLSWKILHFNSFMMKYTLLVYFLNTKHEGYSKRIGRTMGPVHQGKPYLIECPINNSNKPGALKSIYLKIIHLQFGFFLNLFFFRINFQINFFIT